MSDVQIVLTNTAGLSSVMSFWVFVAANGFSGLRGKLNSIGGWTMVVGFAALTIAIILRGVEAARFPLSNLYESLLWFAWAIMGGYIWINRAYGLGQLGWLASMVAATMFLYGSWLPSNQHEITPLVPALVSYWRQIHVPPLIVSYAVFFLSGLCGLLQLWAAGRRQAVYSSVATIAACVAAIVLGTFSKVSVLWLQLLFVGGSALGMVISWFMLKHVDEGRMNVERAGIYDDVSYRCVAIGFPLLTIGIITGGLWANHAWGSYWSWDPKESMALVTWLSYAAYIHLRIHRELSAEKLSLVAVVGLILTLLTYLGFNTLGFGGLHSYGQFK